MAGDQLGDFSDLGSTRRGDRLRPDDRGRRAGATIGDRGRFAERSISCGWHGPELRLSVRPAV